MNLTERIELLNELKPFLNKNNESFNKIVNNAYLNNKWFAKNFIYNAANAINNFFLDADILKKFVAEYNFTEPKTKKTIGIVCAGNIPFVGFHDFLMCFLSGNIAQIKLSSKDEILMKYILQSLESLNSDFKNYYNIVLKLQNFDAVIATGSNNSSRYFEYYFGKYKNILRKNRNSVAILTGKESEEDLINFGQDVFNYFGLGCRSISKIFVPKNYDFNFLLATLENNFDFAQHHDKYRNNYDYQLAIFLLNKTPHFVSKNLIVTESENIASAISVLHYQTYNNVNEVIEKLVLQKNEIQCIVAKNLNNCVNFGEAQQPKINDFADGVDTFDFITSL